MQNLLTDTRDQGKTPDAKYTYLAPNQKGKTHWKPGWDQATSCDHQ